MSDGELVDEKTVARILRVDPRTVRRWRKAGKVPFYALPGGGIRYCLAELIAVHLADAVRMCPQMSPHAHSIAASGIDTLS